MAKEKAKRSMDGLLSLAFFRLLNRVESLFFHPLLCKHISTCSLHTCWPFMFVCTVWCSHTAFTRVRRERKEKKEKSERSDIFVHRCSLRGKKKDHSNSNGFIMATTTSWKKYGIVRNSIRPKRHSEKEHSERRRDEPQRNKMQWNWYLQSKKGKRRKKHKCVLVLLFFLYGLTSRFGFIRFFFHSHLPFFSFSF